MKPVFSRERGQKISPTPIFILEKKRAKITYFYPPDTKKKHSRKLFRNTFSLYSTFLSLFYSHTSLPHSGPFSVI
ncbi:MAG: hypothetical protein IKQ32_04720 [Prevotella sp.]|jgi:hypothetical protein|nr:hypothetical protein [Prevotella sp.]